MKRIKSIDGIELYDLIRSRDNVEKAVANACRDHHKDPSVIRIKEDPEPYIDAVCQILDDQTFHYSRFREKRIFERGKWRELCYTRTFPDRVIQHAVLQIVAPILLGTCIRDTYAAREGKGIHHGKIQLCKDMSADPTHTRYCGKLDIRHFFDSVPRQFLFDSIKRKIKCSRTLEILHRMIFECPGDRGLPIGLYSSQIFSTFCLTYFDHWVKEVLGWPYYYRYMDDMVLLAGTKAHLHNLIRHIRAKVEEMGLHLKGNWQVFPVEIRGIDFMGYVMRHDYALIRKRNKIAYIRSCNHIVRNIRRRRGVTMTMMCSKISYEGMLGWCDSKNLVKRYDGRVYRMIEFGCD